MDNEPNVVLLMRGVSGSGKSTLAKRIEKQATRNAYYVRVVSADDYFLDKNGTYRFNPKGLPVAHERCFSSYAAHIKLCKAMSGCIAIVDNTNLDMAHVEKYIHVAENYGWRLRVIHCVATTEVAYARNVHKVPLDTVIRQQKLFAAQYDLFESYNHKKNK